MIINGDGTPSLFCFLFVKRLVGHKCPSQTPHQRESIKAGGWLCMQDKSVAGLFIMCFSENKAYGYRTIWRAYICAI